MARYKVTQTIEKNGKYPYMVLEFGEYETLDEAIAAFKDVSRKGKEKPYYKSDNWGFLYEIANPEYSESKYEYFDSVLRKKLIITFKLEKDEKDIDRS